MTKLRISSGVKTAIIILNEIFALLLIVVVIMSSTYGVNSGSWDDLLRHRSYEQSEYFQTQSVNQATRAIRAAARASRFEKNGVFKKLFLHIGGAGIFYIKVFISLSVLIN